jgi:hypothetical protein
VNKTRQALGHILEFIYFVPPGKRKHLGMPKRSIVRQVSSTELEIVLTDLEGQLKFRNAAQSGPYYVFQVW